MTSIASAAEHREILEGLTANPPRLSPRYFYDDAGSHLFSRITQTPEYYPTRTELSIVRDQGGEIAMHVAPGSVVVELGSGSGDKVIALLSHLREPRAYRPIDISGAALAATEAAVRKAFPALEISPFEGDFTDAKAYEDLPRGAPICVYYSGSTIGNFEPTDAVAFLRSLRGRLHHGDTLLLGADLTKDESVLHAAYNDAQGVTAAFNRNVLRHINARFGSNFDPEAFEHRARYDAEQRRIEMYLVARAPQRVRIGSEELVFVPTRPIHTESSYKFDFSDLRDLADKSGYALQAIVTDPRRWFAEAIFSVT